MTALGDVLRYRLLYGSDDVSTVISHKVSGAQRRALASAVSSVKMTAEECRALCEALPSGLQYLDGYENRVRKYRISTTTVDRYGDIIIANGGRFDNYMRNPVILWAHDRDSLPIGASLKVWVEQDAVYSFALFFDDRVDPSGRSDLVFRFVSAGALPACSIGFLPLQTRRPTEQERRELGIPSDGVIYETWDMLEYSPVSIPANPHALQEHIRHGIRQTLSAMARKGEISERDARILRSYPILPDDDIDSILSNAGVKSTGVVVEKDVSAGNNTVTATAPVLRPYPNEHAARLADPDGFDEFRRTDGGTIYGSITVPKTISIIWGHLKGEDEDAWAPQALRFPVEHWTAEEAKEWLDKNNVKYIAFEPASEKQLADIVAQKVVDKIEPLLQEVISVIRTAIADVPHDDLAGDEAKAVRELIDKVFPSQKG